jgi:hypothetical protein
LLHNNWLALYPRPQFIVFDNGEEFKREFKQICMQDNFGIKSKPNTSHKQLSQASAIIERIHKVVNDMDIVNDILRLKALENNHESLEDNPFDYLLQSTTCLPCY